MTADTPQLISGNLVVDDRGQVAFVNDFTFEGVKRFYVVSNHRQGFVRAWHAHRREAKYVTALQGAALVGAVAVDTGRLPRVTPMYTGSFCRRPSHRYYLSRRDMRMASCP